MHKALVINHLTDTDFYKFSMGQLLLHRFPNEETEWEFKIRTKGVKTAYLKDEVDYQLDHLCTLRFTQAELDYLSTIPWFTKDYIDWLEDFQLKRKYIQVGVEGDNITIKAKGPALKVTWFEIYCLEIVQELWMQDQPVDWELGDKNLDYMISEYNRLIDEGKTFTVADFGCRRRASFAWQDHVIGRMVKECKAFVGTSDVYFAMKYGIKPIGTFAHEMYALAQGLKNVPIRQAQITVWDAWTKEYRGNLGIALSDNFGFKAFIEDFDLFYQKLFDGCRHDSGSPFKWGDLLIKMYEKSKIDPLTKTGCWSDSLDVKDVVDIVDYFTGRIKISIGQGTKMMNNVGGIALNMVMKVIKTNGKDVVKLSDTPGKTMCHSEKYIDYAKEQFDYIPLDEWKVD
jgi:nicotinate phosphoribosyltransferase